MKLFTALYDKALGWAKHRHAPRYLSLLSFSESMIFPIPPDVMLAPMALAKPERAWFYAMITTIASVIGGIFGYWLGYFLFEPVIQPLLQHLGLMSKFDHAITWFKEYGIWVVFIAGFSPIPYKVFTVGAGLMHMAFLPFVLASAIGRGARFYMVAGLMKMGGEKMQDKLRQYIDWLGWGTIVALIIIYFIFR